MVALTMALCTIRRFLFITIFIVSVFAHAALSLIQYDRQALLDVRVSIGTDFFSDFFSDCWSTSCKPFVLGPIGGRREANVPEFNAIPDETPQPAATKHFACKC